MVWEKFVRLTLGDEVFQIKFVCLHPAVSESQLRKERLGALQVNAIQVDKLHG